MYSFFVHNEEPETEDDEKGTETDEEQDQDVEDLQIPRRSNRVRKAPERDGTIVGDWWRHEESLNADTHEFFKNQQHLKKP